MATLSRGHAPQTPPFPEDSFVGSAPRSAMRASFLREIGGLGLPAPRPSTALVTEDDLAALPDAAQRYLRFMGVLGSPRVSSFCLGWYGGFRRKPATPWMRCEAWQYNARGSIARLFQMRMRFLGPVPVVVRDTYVGGRGRMLGKLFDLFPVVDEGGEEIAVGELVTYLNDAIFFAPSLLLGPETTWSTVDDGAFDVALTDGGRTVAARVFLDERGAPRDFSTTDRYYQAPSDPAKAMVRTRWTTPIDGWEMVNGLPRPTHGKAIWHLPEGPFAYADFHVVPGSLVIDVRPGPEEARS